MLGLFDFDPGAAFFERFKEVEIGEGRMELLKKTLNIED